MKVFVTYENSFEKPLAENLVAVLKKIGGMLIYGKITNAGVMLEDWANKPKVNLECTAVSIAPQSYSRPEPAWQPMSYSAEFEYRDGAYYGVLASPPPPSVAARLTREAARELVRPFPPETYEAILGNKKKSKRKVPKPNTTKTGVTIRAIDLEDDHEEE